MSLRACGDVGGGAAVEEGLRLGVVRGGACGIAKLSLPQLRCLCCGLSCLCFFFFAVSPSSLSNMLRQHVAPEHVRCWRSLFVANIWFALTHTHTHTVRTRKRAAQQVSFVLALICRQTFSLLALALARTRAHATCAMWLAIATEVGRWNVVCVLNRNIKARHKLSPRLTLFVYPSLSLALS